MGSSSLKLECNVEYSALLLFPGFEGIKELTHENSCIFGIFILTASAVALQSFGKSKAEIQYTERALTLFIRCQIFYHAPSSC